MITSNKELPTPAKFISKFFESRIQTHVYHLQTTSYAAHKALNEFYDELLDAIDTLIESYQGKYGLINVTVPACATVDPISAIEGLANLTDGGNVYTMFKETWIQNQLDEISMLCYQTFYKLKFLK